MNAEKGGYWVINKAVHSCWVFYYLILRFYNVKQIQLQKIKKHSYLLLNRKFKLYAPFKL